MDGENSKELKKLKRDLFDLMEARRDERELMLKFINTISVLVPEKEGVSDEIDKIRSMIVPGEDFDLAEIDEEIRNFKNILIERENSGRVNEQPDILERMSDRLIESCRILKRIMAAILDDFYPLPDDMKRTADLITIECKGDPDAIEFNKPALDLLEFIDRIRIKISSDFNETNMVFFNLLEQIKELEKSFATEFEDATSLREIEYFEMNINREVGSIAESFTSFSSVQEIRNIVVEKLKKIKDLVSLKKKEETRKNQAARKNIKRLNDRIMQAEQKARRISQKAKQFQQAAMKDGLTGLFNRGAFDLKLSEAISNFYNSGVLFSIIMFDVNKFKEINDSLGHIAGDKVLQKVAECLNETFRKDDFIARYGGDEFIIIIEGISEEMCRERIRLFNQNLRKRRFVSRVTGEIVITVSTGTAVITEGDTFESIISRADMEMYEAKNKVT